jgi:hypothetical protein
MQIECHFEADDIFQAVSSQNRFWEKRSVEGQGSLRDERRGKLGFSSKKNPMLNSCARWGLEKILFFSLKFANDLFIKFVDENEALQKGRASFG